jgi:hypothetical protein
MFDLATLKAVTRTMFLALIVVVIVGTVAWQASEYGDNCINGYEEVNCETEDTIEIGDPVSIVRPIITEDDPRWNCETMGNLICGSDN